MAAVTFHLIRLPRLLLIGVVRAYQVLASPFPSPCRYYPTCSTYALGTLEKYGAVKGSWLAAKRILRCHPFAKGGLDPVP